jgi:nicotinate-nucleotide pyrophosphorylase (carboxylating)
MKLDIEGFDLNEFIDRTLAEDLGYEFEGGGHDITSSSVIPKDTQFEGAITSREELVVAGMPIAEAFFRNLDPKIEIEILCSEGERVKPDTKLMCINGNARAILTAERSALNTIQHMSGVATIVRSYVEAMDNPNCTLLDTRKTIPGLRQLEKYAVRLGGGSNHRLGLWDIAMIKDNHVQVAGGVAQAVQLAIEAGVAKIICEVDTLDQIEPAIQAGATRILLDNMEPSTLRKAVKIVSGRAPTEASGGITLETIKAMANTGVDYISVGRLTQSAPAMDIGLDLFFA